MSNVLWVRWVRFGLRGLEQHGTLLPCFLAILSTKLMFLMMLLPFLICRELLGQHYTETHYLADGREITEKPDVQVWVWSNSSLLEEEFLGHHQ